MAPSVSRSLPERNTTMVKFNAGDKVEILIAGEWDGPYTMTNEIDPYRPEHIVLNGPSGLFVHYNDAPYNTRKVG